MGNNSFMMKSVIAIGALGFAWYLYAMFFSELKGDGLYWLLAACVTTLLCPIGLLYKRGVTVAEIRQGIIILVASLVVNLFFVYMSGYKDKGFIDNLFFELTSEAFRWIYLVLLAGSIICARFFKKIGIWLSAIILGLMIPAILAAIFYLIIFIIGLLFFIVYLLGSKGSSSPYSTHKGNLFVDVQDDVNSSPQHVPNNTSYYTFFIAWSDGVHAPYTCTEKYPKDVSAARVESDLKKKFGSTAQLVDFHIWDPAHDSALNYR